MTKRTKSPKGGKPGVPRAKGKRRWLDFLLLLIFILAVLAALGEFAIRTLAPGNLPVNEVYGHVLLKHRPFARYVNRSENPNTIIYNNLGFHDRNRSLAAKNERVLFLGDSFVEGPQVPVGNLFTSIVEENLRTSDTPVEVLNGGVSGTNTAYQYLLWKEFFKPNVKTDRIILCFYNGDDLPQNVRFLNERVLRRAVKNYDVFLNDAGEPVVEITPYPFLQRLAKKAVERSALACFVYNKLYAVKAERRRKRLLEKLASETQKNKTALRIAGAWESSIERTLALISRWDRELTESGIKFSVVIIPPATASQGLTYGNAYKDRFADRLEKWAAANGVPFLKLYFKGRDPFKLYSFDGEHLGHFGFEGHRLAAEQIAQWLGRQMPPENNQADKKP